MGNKGSLSDRKGTMSVSIWSKEYIDENMRVFLQHFNGILNQLINWCFFPVDLDKGWNYYDKR